MNNQQDNSKELNILIKKNSSLLDDIQRLELVCFIQRWLLSLFILGNIGQLIYYLNA